MKPPNRKISSGMAPVFDKAIAPSKILAGLVRYWHLTSNGKILTRNLRFAPDENMEIFFDLHPRNGKKIPMLSGLLLKQAPLKLDRRVDITGIRLYPGSFYALFGRPAHLFANKIVPLETAIGRKALPFKKVFSAGDLKRRIELMNSVLEEIAGDKKPLDPKIRLALEHIARSKAACTVPELAGLTGWTKRWFSEMFKKWIGLPPHLLCNNLKFKEALRELSAGKASALVAYDLGYSDQAHLIHSFKTRTRHTPSDAFRYEAWRRKKVFLMEE
jgi:AraC-like DNA-binding protein